MTSKEEPTNTEGTVPDETTPVTADKVTGPSWTVMDIGAIVVGLSGLAYTLLPWGVFYSRLQMLDIALMLTPVFILVTALLTYAGTLLVKKTNGTRNKAAASIARTCVWASMLTLIPIFIRFISLLISG